MLAGRKPPPRKGLGKLFAETEDWQNERPRACADSEDHYSGRSTALLSSRRSAASAQTSSRSEARGERGTLPMQSMLVWAEDNLDVVRSARRIEREGTTAQVLYWRSFDLVDKANTLGEAADTQLLHYDPTAWDAYKPTLNLEVNLTGVSVSLVARLRMSAQWLWRDGDR